MEQVLTRQGVHTLNGPWDPVMRAYGLAIEETRRSYYCRSDVTSLTQVPGLTAPRRSVHVLPVLRTLRCHDDDIS